MRIAITDVAYQDDVACASCVLADGFDAQFPLQTCTALRTPVDDYVPGSFWQRELPCLLGVLEGLTFDVAVVDGYVWLDGQGRKGLGAHLYDRLGLPVVGIAKTAFDGSAHAELVLRGESSRPLYVTAAGLDPKEVAASVRGMHGPHRIPTLLQLADRLARSMGRS